MLGLNAQLFGFDKYLDAIDLVNAANLGGLFRNPITQDIVDGVTTAFSVLFLLPKLMVPRWNQRVGTQMDLCRSMLYTFRRICARFPSFLLW